jgi:hypothetical protein
MRPLLLAAFLMAGCVDGSGEIFTTTASGVDTTTYRAKDAVFLDTSALPLGNYVFEVTDPAGTLLSTDPVSCRGFHVDASGRISGTNDLPCARPVAEDVAGGGLTVRLMPYGDAPGTTYVVQVTPAQTYADLDRFDPRYTMSDTFDVRCCRD